MSKEANARYDAKNTVHYGFKLNRNTDTELIALLDGADNKQALIKTALKGLIEKENEIMANIKYRVLPEYQDKWTTESAECIVSMEEIERLAREWNVSVDELMEQVEEI